MQAMEDGSVAGGDVGIDDLQLMVMHRHQNSVKQTALAPRAANGDEHVEAADMQAHVRTQVGLQAGLATWWRQGGHCCHGGCVATGIVHDGEAMAANWELMILQGAVVAGAECGGERGSRGSKGGGAVHLVSLLL